MELSQSIKSKIKAWEGCRLTAYRCPSGVLTIGYGHTGSDVTPGKQITQEEADALFDIDINRFAREVENLLPAGLVNCNQFDALVSFAYNVGIRAFSQSTLFKKVYVNPNDPHIGGEFVKWVFSNGEVLPGLLKRRKAEAAHYFS